MPKLAISAHADLVDALHQVRSHLSVTHTVSPASTHASKQISSQSSLHPLTQLTKHTVFHMHCIHPVCFPIFRICDTSLQRHMRAIKHTLTISVAMRRRMCQTIRRSTTSPRARYRRSLARAGGARIGATNTLRSPKEDSETIDVVVSGTTDQDLATDKMQVTTSICSRRRVEPRPH